MRADAVVISDVGKVRGNNEDNFFINGKFRKDVSSTYTLVKDCEKRSFGLYAVCDGMGGEECGEFASLTAVRELKHFFNKDFLADADKYIDKANKCVCDESAKKGGRMGTTLAVLYIEDDKAFGFNVGDSRMYLYREGTLKRISKDHTHAQSLADMGLIGQDEVDSHKGAHKLTQHLGILPDEMIIEPFKTGEIKVLRGDVFIICSDGITDMLTDDGICRIVGKNKDAESIAHELVDAALENGGKDNATVMVIKPADEKGGFWSRIFG